MPAAAISLQNLGKMYRLYDRPADRLIDALGIDRLLFWRKHGCREFWAIRQLDLEVSRGQRLGVVGRNGAGKSTLLKLICGNLAPSEGTARVCGRIQALLEIGTGFHPDFTGRQNIRAALAYQCMSSAEISEAEKDIVDFAEIDGFIDQPVKTYSKGMYARLAFSVATAVRPDVLIIDEVLGAGDAYFSTKCAGRMKQLVESQDSTVLLVSHATEQILRYCEQCIWLDRGKIVCQGPSMEVVKEYQKFINALEDRKLKAKNQKRNLGIRGSENLSNCGDSVVLNFVISGTSGACCDVSTISLEVDGATEETLQVGGIQDLDSSQMAFVAISGSTWSGPLADGSESFRRLSVTHEGGFGSGNTVFRMYAVRPKGNYSLRVRYRYAGAGDLQAIVQSDGRSERPSAALPPTGEAWSDVAISITEFLHALPNVTVSSRETVPNEGNVQETALQQPAEGAAVSRWCGDNSLVIARVELLGDSGAEQAVFVAGSALALHIYVKAHRKGTFNVLPTASLYRLDGILVSNFIAKPCPMELCEGEMRRFRLELSPLALGNGSFTFSAAIFDSVVDDHSRYDLVDRSYEFKVVDNPQHAAGDLVHHAAAWRIDGMPQQEDLRSKATSPPTRVTVASAAAVSEKRMSSVVASLGSETSDGKLKILVLYDERSTHINTVRDHLESFVNFSRNEVFYAVATHGAPCQCDLAAFDVVIVHYSVRVCLGTHISPSYKRQLQEFGGLKVLFIQDEYECTEVSRQFIETAGIRVVFTALDDVAVKKVYPPDRFAGVQFIENLTGYVPWSLESLAAARPLAERKVMIGYRGRRLGYWYGNLGQEKLNIGRQMKAVCDERGIACDIAWEDADRIYGSGWNDFLQSARATLGTPSGANLFDDTGSIRKAIEAARRANPELTYEEAFPLYLAEHEGKVTLDVISPKVFEAIACRTALILFPGGYSGVVRPDEHYIPLQRDFSNVDNVLAKVADDEFVTALTQRAYDDVIASRKYNYPAFVRMVDDVLSSYVRRPNRTVLRTGVTSICLPGEDAPVFPGRYEMLYLPSKTVYGNCDRRAAMTLAPIPLPLVSMLPPPGLARRMGRRLPEFVKRPIRRILSL